MRRWLAAVTFSCCSLVAGEALTEYQGPDYIKLKALLPPAPDAQACYARTYDPDHLKRHPKQKVTEMVFSLRYVTLGEDEAVIVATEGGGTEKRYFDYDFTLAAKTKEHDRTLYASGDCASAEGDRLRGGVRRWRHRDRAHGRKGRHDPGAARAHPHDPGLRRGRGGGS